MAVNIVLTVAGQGSGSGGESREFVYSIVDPTAPLVTLSLADTTGVTSYLWEILNQPIGASTSLSSSTDPTPTFTPTNSIWGTYLIRCTIIRSAVQESGTVALSFKTPNRDMRFPAAGEKVEFSTVNGWMEAEQVLYEIVDNLTTTGGYWDRTGTILSPLNVGDTLQLSDGSATVPSSAYVTDPDTGRFLQAAGVEGFSVGGVAQLLFGNASGPYIKAADGHQYLTIGNYKTTAGGASQVLIEAVGAAANPGGILDLKASSPSGKNSAINVDAINVAGDSAIFLTADSGTSITDNSIVQLLAKGQGPTEAKIRADSTVNNVPSTIDILGTSALGNATINIGVNAGGTGSVYYGNQYTDSLRIRDKNLEDSSVTWNYLEVSSALVEWDTLNTNFGNASLVGILNNLKSASGITVSSGTGINIIPTGIDREINVKDAPANEIDYAAVNGSAYKDAQSYFNYIQGPCSLVSTEGNITDAGSGQIDVSSGNGIAKSTDTENAQTVFFSWSAATSVSLTDNAVSYIFAVYDAVTPYILASTSGSLTNRRDYILLGLVKREGTDVDIRNLGSCSDVVWRLNRKSSIQNNFGPEYGSGIIIGDAGTRYVSLTSGVIFFGLADANTLAFDTSGTDTFDTFYTTDSGTTWVKTTGQTQIDNTQYNDITTGLATVTINQYGVHWVYYDYSGDHMYVLYGVDSYGTVAAAIDAPEPPNKPWQINQWGFLVGKVIIQRNGTENEDVISVFLDDIAGGTSVSTHNNLSGLQGGVATEYYHLTSADYTDLTDNLPIPDEAIVFGNSDGELSYDGSNFKYDYSTNQLAVVKPSSGTGSVVALTNLEATNQVDMMNIYNDSTHSEAKAIYFSGDAGGGQTVDVSGHKIWTEGSMTLGHGYGTGVTKRESYLWFKYDDESLSDWSEAVLVSEAQDPILAYARVWVRAGLYGGALSGQILLEASNRIVLDSDNWARIETGSGNLTLTGGANVDMSSTTGDILLGAGDDIWFDDSNRTGSTWATATGISLSSNSSEWDAMEVLGGGEVSIFALISAAASSGGIAEPAGQIVYGDATGTGVDSESNFHWDATNDELTITKNVNKDFWYSDDGACIRLDGPATQGTNIFSSKDTTIGIRSTTASYDPRLNIYCESAVIGNSLLVVESFCQGTGREAQADFIAWGINEASSEVNIRAETLNEGTDGTTATINLHANAGGTNIAKLDFIADYADYNECGIRDLGPASYNENDLTVTSNAFAFDPDIGIHQRATITADSTWTLGLPTGGASRTTLIVYNSGASAYTLTTSGSPSVTWMGGAADGVSIPAGERVIFTIIYDSSWDWFIGYTTES